MEFNVSEAAAYAVLYGVLLVFALLALGSGGWFLDYLPPLLSQTCLLRREEKEESTSWRTLLSSSDYFLAARNSAGPWTIALSYFASGMGAWVVYGTTEMGANPALSWIGVIGYSSASAAPALLICVLGPHIRKMTRADEDNSSFSTADFGRLRYGRVMQLTIMTMSVFYMFIFIVAELTSISNIFKLLTNNESNKMYGIGITLAITIFTALYTTAAGLPASIVTDKFQGIIMILLVLLLTLATTIVPENSITRAEFAVASNWTVQGLQAAVSLIIAVASAEMFNQSTWQRVWAAESVPALRQGFLLGSSMIFFLMMFFGVMGMISYANDPGAYDRGEKWAYLSFFELLSPLSNGWHVMVLILVTALCSSTVDSLQTGLTCIFSRDLVKLGYNPLLISRILLVLVNIPAVVLAARGFSVLELFLIADLACATCVFPVFLGLQKRDYGMLKAPTELGAFLGCWSGVVAVLVNGIINDASGGLWEYFWLRNGAICALCGSKTMVTFIVTPIVSAVMTHVFSFFDVYVRGERARQPIFHVPFDSTDAELGQTEEAAEAVELGLDKGKPDEEDEENEVASEDKPQ
jgi:solute:Na+ symporter, SSS family